MSFGDLKQSEVSLDDEWETDARIIRGVTLQYGPIILDAAATAENQKSTTGRFITKEENALAVDWCERVADLPTGVGIIHTNPPYSKPNKPAFTEKSIATALALDGRATEIVLPANMRDGWFHDLLLSRVWGMGGQMGHGRLGDEKLPALLLTRTDPITGLRTDLWFLRGGFKFVSKSNPKKNQSTSGVVVAAFIPQTHQQRTL